MTDPVVAVFMLGLFIFMVMLGFPLAFTLNAMGLVFGYFFGYRGEDNNAGHGLPVIEILDTGDVENRPAHFGGPSNGLFDSVDT